MILFLYNVVLLLALIAGAPWWLWQMATKRKYREGLSERLGRVPVRRLHGPESARAPGLESHSKQPFDAASARPVIWLHAVSVGEVLAVSSLVAELDATLPGYRVLISTTTRTGQQLARTRFGAHRVFYCPLDLPCAVRAYLNALQPAMLVLAETEFWPNLLSGCYRRKIPVVVVNARISDRSWPRYLRLKRLWKPFLSRLTEVLAQTPTDAGRLLALGCENVHVAGNLKFDVRAAQDTAATRILREIAGDISLLVAGSTHDGEEIALLSAWSRLIEIEPKLAMVLAPRHEERFKDVAELLEKSGYPWRRRLDYPWREPSDPDQSPKPLQPGEILLLDSSGELASVYSLASAALVGGSLVPTGGHNPLEPAQFAVPLVMGAYTENFRGIVESLQAADGMRVATQENLADVLASLQRDKAEAAAIGRNAKAVFDRHAGATARTVAVIAEVLNRRSRP